MADLVREVPLTFLCRGDRLVGILHRPSAAPSLGMVLVVGGPQYRVGSHRQFVLLGRHLASAGIAVLRFDCRGMGDSQGEFPGFEHIEPDIAAAVDTLMSELPSLRRIVLWGLCDATSGMCAHAKGDPRVAGVVLVNPWIRSEASQARTQLRHYYLARVTQPDFLSKVFKGDLNPLRSARALFGNIASAVGPLLSGGSAEGGGGTPLARRMAADLEQFRGRVLLILSGRDLTAKEFADATRSNTRWRSIYARSRAQRREFAEADHTFSRRVWRDRVAAWTLDWIRGLEP